MGSPPPQPYQPQPKENRPKQLAKDVPAVNHIKERWTTTHMTVHDIAKEIGRPRTTVQTLVNRLLERGELPAERPK